MESEDTDVRQSPAEKTEIEKNDSADNFQKFIYELFDRNGILNDLRAYLRGHIVNVLKSAQTGDPPLCQKNFTQRLELVYQALNILIAEYLLQLDFKYTLSVFVSEIPLSNMVFDFAKILLKNDASTHNLKFQDSDVWSVLNYLGVKCDCEHASSVLDMYRSEQKVPLLLCILKCMPMYREQSVDVDEEKSSQDSLISSANSFDTLETKAKSHKNTSHHQSSKQNCKHYTFCKSCQNRISRLKEKYRQRKRDVYMEAKKDTLNVLNLENFMKNVNIMEKRIVNEMFEQLQSVYEAEVDLVRREEERRVKRTLATHALQLQQQQEEMEVSLKTKQAELESSAQHKKQFLWGVARALRDQHEHVVRALTLLKDEREKLTQKENNLKTQLSQAEETLRKKGEEMRTQISKELEILDGHLECMRRERESLNKERCEVENLKSLCDSKTGMIAAHGGKEREELRQRYDALKEEVAVLKKYIESSKAVPKCVAEGSTMTEHVEVPSNTNILNNTNFSEKNARSDVTDREARPPNQLVNDLKKLKNVNFSQTHLGEMYHDLSRGKSRCSQSSDDAAAGASETENLRERDTIQRLLEENASLKDYARQQREHISALRWSRARAPGVLRPRTAPALVPATNYFTVHRVNPSSSANTFSARKGAGEELNLFPPQSPTLLPSDPIPFVGILRDRHSDNRRHLINQWRALKRRSSPLGGINKVRPSISIQRDQRAVTTSAEPVTHVYPGVRIADELETNNPVAGDTSQEVQDNRPKTTTREKSPKTVLKEAKENLRNKSSIKEKALSKNRDKSPNSMLREAKLRLRKLEIEAEAVEKSYLDFKKRQAELREERKSLSRLEDQLNTDIVKNLEISKSRSFHKFCDDSKKMETNIPTKETNDAVKYDFDKYVRDYQTKMNIGETHFKNRNVAIEKVKPIPFAYSDNKDKRKNVDYLATPMMEFRKLYHSEKERNITRQCNNTNISAISGNPKIFNHNNIKKDLVNINNKEMERDIPDNVNFKDLRDGNDGTEVKIKKYDERSKDTNKSKELLRSKKSLDNTLDFEAELEINEKSIPEDVIGYENIETLKKIKRNKVAELAILKENINKMYNFKSPHSIITPIKETSEVTSTRANLLEKIENHLMEPDCNNKNVLRVEVESSCEVNKVQMSESQEDLVIVVQSSANTKKSDLSEEAIKSIPVSTEVGSKERTPRDWETERIETPKSRRSESPEKAAQLTRNDVLNAIFHADDNKNASSIDINLESSNNNEQQILNDNEPYDDYPDDFSADVDNYNSRSEYGDNSPISLPKSEFWDN